MARRTVFEQIVKLLSRRQFEEIVARHQGNKRVRQLDCWTWLGALLFGQLTGHDSIRAMERVFCHGRHRFSKLGFQSIRRSTLAEANHVRPLDILRDTLALVIERARQAGPLKHGFRFKGSLLALDASVIRLCLSLSPWAQYHHGKGGCKLHTAIDLAGELPDFVCVTPGKAHDVPVAKQHFSFRRGSTLIFDRGYWSASWLNELNQAGIFFVTRERKNNYFKAVECRPTNRTQGYSCDQIVYQVIRKKRGHYRVKYRGKLRRISYKDPETGKRLTFITNRFDLAASTICQLYKARWKVELFFKTLKQHLKIKKFLGTTLHAVTAQILIALIAYVLVHILRSVQKARLSMPDAMAIIGSLLLLHEPVNRIFGQLPRTTRYPPTPQMAFAF
jgi:hypothetical protein